MQRADGLLDKLAIVLDRAAADESTLIRFHKHRKGGSKSITMALKISDAQVRIPKYPPLWHSSGNG